LRRPRAHFRHLRLPFAFIVISLQTLASKTRLRLGLWSMRTPSSG
jgi:hypothetical protein